MNTIFNQFMIITSETDLAEATALAKRLREILKGTEFPKVNKVMCSFGVTMFNNNEHMDSLVE